MNKTAERTMNLHVDHDSAKHTHAHSRVVMRACCAPLGAVAAVHRRHLSKDGPARVGKRLPQHTLRAVAAPRVRFSTCHARYPPAAIIGCARCGWLRWHSARTACAGGRRSSARRSLRYGGRASTRIDLVDFVDFPFQSLIVGKEELVGALCGVLFSPQR